MLLCVLPVPDRSFEQILLATCEHTGGSLGDPPTQAGIIYSCQLPQTVLLLGIPSADILLNPRLYEPNTLWRQAFPKSRRQGQDRQA